MHPRKWKSVVERGSLRFKSTEGQRQREVTAAALGLRDRTTHVPPVKACFIFNSHACVHAKSLQLCPTVCDLMDCSPPGSSVHGILQARLPYPSPGDLPDPGIEPVSPALAGGFYTTEPQRRPLDSHES